MKTEKLFKVADIRKLEHQVGRGDISYSRMVEIINEKVSEQINKSIEDFKVQQAKALLKLHSQNKTADFSKEWNYFEEVYLQKSAIKSLTFDMAKTEWTVAYTYDIDDDVFKSLEDMIVFFNADKFGS